MIQEFMKQVRLEDANLSKEAFEVLTITLALCPAVLEALIREKFWHLFVIDTLLLSGNRWVNMFFFANFVRCVTVSGKIIAYPLITQNVSCSASVKGSGGSLLKRKMKFVQLVPRIS